MKATISVGHRVNDGADIVPFRVSRTVYAKTGRVLGKSNTNVGVKVKLRAYKLGVFL